MAEAKKNLWGVAAEFTTTRDLYHACEKVRDAGYEKWDAHSPFPVHGLDKAMGMKPSTVGIVTFVAGITGGSCGMLMQWWMSAVDYPLVISGKPLFSWQAFVPITFELSVLFGAFITVGAMFALYNGLPRPYHPLFSLERFSRVTDDRFFISIEAKDSRFDADKLQNWFREMGASHVELVYEEQ